MEFITMWFQTGQLLYPPVNSVTYTRYSCCTLDKPFSTTKYHCVVDIVAMHSLLWKFLPRFIYYANCTHVSIFDYRRTPMTTVVNWLHSRAHLWLNLPWGSQLPST